ncbi:STAS/SEC14 domain-containing protein [Nannocystis bainbridge]|uniref:STAS/SEC14 domain-containing protein n=1 Tax=Nannocystis bainbridge TaxID=2995303 RepID=A0ABT5EB97_9BACT|nr:STAS/SEC14 domain-containing protein [Nannocystis bainbridge]MDC0723145.1 STAS/SEC14 domain-containing protein [Nannocystis bainbridge]
MATTSASEHLQIMREQDLAHIKVRGPFDLAVAHTVHGMLADIMAEKGRCYLLADLTRMDGIPTDARKHVGEWHKQHSVSGVGVYGASFAMRSLATLMFRAIRLVTGKPTEMAFVRDEAEARRWIEALRAAQTAARGGRHVHQ